MIALVLILSVNIVTLDVQNEDNMYSARPNIVLIMTDDQGVGDLGANGNQILSTPRIDQLAGESATFSRFYVSPVCTPTRASLMTGRYNYRTRAIDTWNGRAMMEPDEVTIAELLREAGYSTGIFGKWHLGDCYPLRPMDQGFDESVVHKGGGLAQPTDMLETKGRYTDATLYHNGKEYQSSGYCTDVYVDHAITFIEKAAEAKQPFFAYIATNAPHGPFHDVPPDLYKKYSSMDLSSVAADGANTDRIARIYAMVENIDSNVGRVLDVIDKLNLTEQTLVLYLHDNGPIGGRFNAGLRGTKSQVFEGGIRSPLFVRWPNRIQPELSIEEIAAHIDILPTILQAAEVAMPDDLNVDGQGLMPLLEQRDEEWPQRSIVLQSHRGDKPEAWHQFAVVEDRWKLLRASGFGRSEAKEDHPFQLFDLKTDPFEQHDVLLKHPEVVERMKNVYKSWLEDVSSTRPNNYAPPRIIIGSRNESPTILTRMDWKNAIGGGFGRDGTWHVNFEKEGTYRFKAIFDRIVDNVVVTVEVDDQRWTSESNHPSSSIDIVVNEISKGDAGLRVLLQTTGEKPLAPYHVIVEFVE